MSEGLDIARLRRAIIVYATIGVFGMAMLSALSAIIPLYRELRHTQQDRVRQVVQTRIRAIEQFARRARSVTLQITSRTRARGLLESYNRGSLGLEDYQRQTAPILQDALRLSDEVRGIVRLDPTGAEVARVGQPIPPETWPEPPDPSVPVADRGPIAVDGEYVLLLRAGIYDPDGRHVGWDVVCFDLETVRQILAGRGGLGESGRVRIAMMAAEGPMLFAAESFDSRLRPYAPADFLSEALTRFVDGDEGPRLIKDAAERSLHVIAEVEDTPWWIVASMNPQELYAPVFRQLLWTLGCAGLLALAGAGGMLLLVRPLTEDMLLHSDALKRKVREATAELEERNALLHAVNEELAKHNQRFEQELKLAQSVQLGFLPKSFPRTDHVEFEQYYLTCEILGGDLFDVFDIGEDHIGVYIADVSGHGVSAALISGLLRMAVSSVRESNAGGSGGPFQVDLLHPGEVILRINRLLKHEIPEFDFITMLYAVLDLRKRTIRIASAGHPDPIRIAPDDGMIESWAVPTGGALGISAADQCFPDIEKPIHPRDKIVFYTDGLVEALNPAGEEFGKDRLLDVLRRNAGAPAKPMIDAIGEAVRGHRGGEAVSDDFCVLIAELKPPGPPAPA